MPLSEILRREGLYATDLTYIQQEVKEGALERLPDRPGGKEKEIGLGTV
jgi:hypothetical protein